MLAMAGAPTVLPVIPAYFAALSALLLLARQVVTVKPVGKPRSVTIAIVEAVAVAVTAAASAVVTTVPTAASAIAATKG